MAQQPIPSDFPLVSNIVVSGMGGSALGGRVVANLERQVLKVPIITSTEYHLPNFVNDKSLVVISSYSGNTEETIHSLAEARARDAKIFVITTGGTLAEIASKNQLPCYLIDPKFNLSGQPRMGLGYAVFALISLLARCQLINPISHLGDIPEYLTQKQSQTAQFQQLARILKDKIPVLVSSEHLKGAIHCFKNQLNENAKNFVAAFDIPELNHHLMEGLTFPESNSQNLHFVFFNSDNYHPEVKKRYSITMDVVSRQKISHTSIDLSGPNRIFEVMETIQMGGFVSYYLSQENGVDPGPIPWVDYFKDEIRKMV